jgi:hypothetical protein
MPDDAIDRSLTIEVMKAARGWLQVYHDAHAQPPNKRSVGKVIGMLDERIETLNKEKS